MAGEAGARSPKGGETRKSQGSGSLFSLADVKRRAAHQVDAFGDPYVTREEIEALVALAEAAFAVAPWLARYSDAVYVVRNFRVALCEFDSEASE